MLKKRLYEKAWKFFYAIFLSVFVLFVFIVFFQKRIPFFQKYLDEGLTIVGTSFDEVLQVIPANAREIKFTFSSPLDPDSVTPQTVTIKPHVDGSIHVYDNVIVFSLATGLVVDSEYQVTFTKHIKSREKKPLTKEYTYILRVGPVPKVVKIFPSGSVQSLHQNITVFFSQPVVPLSSLSRNENLPCPIRITPSLSGKCKWTSTSILEFEPTPHLQGATTYTVQVGSFDDSAGNGGKSTTGQDFLFGTFSGAAVVIQTPRLQAYVPGTFDPQKGIQVRFNFPVDLDRLREKVRLSTFTGEVIPVTILPLTGSATAFYIVSQGRQFGYDEAYTLSIQAGLPPRDGTDGMEAFSTTVRSLPFVAFSNVYKAFYSPTGFLVNTRYIPYDVSCKGRYQYFTSEYGSCYEPFVPVEDWFMHLHFNVPIDLATNPIRLISQTGLQIPLEISYVPENQFDEEKGKEVPTITKKTVRVKPRISLVPHSVYTLVVDQGTHFHATQEKKIQLYTAPDVAIKNFRFVDYKTACFWTSVPLVDYYNNDDEQSRKSYITTTPQSFIAGISPVYEKEDPCYDKVATERNRVGYRLSLRLNPQATYKVHFLSGLTSKYGTKLPQSVSFVVQTSNALLDDVYVGTTHKQRNVVPTGLPLMINLQTIHADKVHLSVCTMNEKGVLEYLINPDVFPVATCLFFTGVDVNVRNKGWNVSSTVLDIESDIVGKSLTSPFVLLQGALTGHPNLLSSNLPSHLKDSLRFSSLYIRENLSLVLEKGFNKHLLIVTDFSGNTVPGLEFTFYQKQGKQYRRVDVQVALNARTNVYEITPNGQTFDVIFARKPGFFGFLDLTWDATTNYDYGYIGGEGTSEKDYLYVYTDRPLYKPGDTVYFKGLLRRFTLHGYGRSPIKSGTLYIFHTDSYTEVTRLQVYVDQNSNFTGMFRLPQDVKLGQFEFHFCPGGYEHLSDNCVERKLYPIERFYVEEYRKPAFKIDVVSQKVQGGSKLTQEKSDQHQELEVMVGEIGKYTVSPSYYVGGTISNVTGFYEVYRQNYFFDAKEYVDYQFGKGHEYYNCVYRGNCYYGDYFLGRRQNFYVGKDGEGHFIYAFGERQTGFIQKILEYQQPKEAEKIYSFAITIRDPMTARSVTKTISTVVHTTDAYVGIKAPYRIGAKKEIPLKGVVLDWQARPLANRNVRLALVKREVKRVKKQGIDGIFYYDYEMQETVVDEASVSSDAKGSFTKVFTPKEEGDYRILAFYVGKNGHAFVSSHDCYVGGNDFVVRSNDNNTVTEIIADAQRVRVGEVANFTVKSPVNTGFLIAMVEKDDGILDYYTYPITSYTPTISIPVKQEYYPNFYTKVFLIGTQTNNPLPLYKRALAVTRVDTAYKKLFVKISLQKENVKTDRNVVGGENVFSPRDRILITVHVTDSKGNPVSGANGSIAIVDQSLLALKGNPKKNPFAYFFDMRRYLGVDTFIGLKWLIEKLEVKNASDGSKGGDGDMVKGGSSKKKRGVFKDTAWWLADFTTNVSGMFTVLTDALPDNLTTREVEVLVNTLDGSVGINQATFLTTQSVVIDDNLPDFLGEGDQVLLSPVVHNKTGKPRDFVFFITGTNAVFSKTTYDIHVPASGQQKLYIPMIVQKRNTEDQVRIEMAVREKASGGENQISDSLVKYIKLLPTVQTETTTTFGFLDDASLNLEEKKVVTEYVSVDKKTMSGELLLSISPNLVGQVLSGIAVVTQDPYGCLEQRFTTMRARVYTKQLHDILGKPFAFTKHTVRRWIDANEGYKNVSYDETIREYLASVEKFQKPDGGFVYRQSENFQQSSSFWLTAYVLASLGKLGEVGYKAPYEVVRKALSYLKSRWYELPVCSLSSSPSCIPLEEKLFAIQALLTYNPQDYDAYKMREVLSDNPSFMQEKSLSVRLLTLQVMQKLLGIDKLSHQVKGNLTQEIAKIIHGIIGNDLIFTPQAAYLGKTSYRSRLQNTAVFVDILANYGEEKPILAQMIKRLISQKKNGHRGSTQDTILVIQALVSYIRSLRLGDLDVDVAVFVNEKKLKNPDAHYEVKENSKRDYFTFDRESKNGMLGWKIPFSLLEQQNQVSLQAKGRGTVYYDMTLQYYVDTKNIPQKDYGFFVKRTYYLYDDYNRIMQQKYREWVKYMRGEISYNDLTYPKSVFSYLSPVMTGKVGDVLLAVVSIATTETRDQVAIDSYIPAGAVLLNTNLATTQRIHPIQTAEYQWGGVPGDFYDGFTQEFGESDFPHGNQFSPLFEESEIYGIDQKFCDIMEHRMDRYFCYKDVLYPGTYTFSYVMQLTHAGVFHLLPTKAFEFYAPATFGRTSGTRFTITK